jgi:hypothetical protein
MLKRQGGSTQRPHPRRLTKRVSLETGGLYVVETELNAENGSQTDPTGAPTDPPTDPPRDPPTDRQS